MPEFAWSWRGDAIRVDARPLSRAVLYGDKKRIAVDAHGDVCVSALLTRDGAALLPAGAIADLYLDEDGDVVERADLLRVEVGGDSTSATPTISPGAAELTPANMRDLLDCAVAASYFLDAGALAPDLARALARGETFTFQHRASAKSEPKRAFLFANTDGVFVLVASDLQMEFASRDAAIFADDEDEDGDADGFDFEEW